MAAIKVQLFNKNRSFLFKQPPFFLKIHDFQKATIKHMKNVYTNETFLAFHIPDYSGPSNISLRKDSFKNSVSRNGP